MGEATGRFSTSTLGGLRSESPREATSLGRGLHHRISQCPAEQTTCLLNQIPLRNVSIVLSLIFLQVPRVVSTSAQRRMLSYY